MKMIEVPVGRPFRFQSGIFLRIADGIDAGTYGSGYPVFQAVDTQTGKVAISDIYPRDGSCLDEDVERVFTINWAD